MAPGSHFYMAWPTRSDARRDGPSPSLTNTSTRANLMFVSRLFAPLSAVALVAMGAAPDASAQRIASPVGVATPSLGHHSHYRPPGYNPIVDRDGFTDVEYDPFSNVIDVNRQRVSKRLSAYDPNRGYVDPGSLRHVDRWIRVNGQWVREHGTTWTSHGVPHGNLTRDRSTFVPHHPYPGHHGGIRHNDRDTVIYSVPNNPQSVPGRRGNGGIRHNDRDTVIYSVPSNPAPQNGNGGGVRHNDRDTVLFSTQNGGSANNGSANNGSANNGNRGRLGQIRLPRGIRLPR